MHKTTERFRRSFEKLPEFIKELAKQNFEMLKQDPYHPSLHFKKIDKFWSVRIGYKYRALAIEDKGDFIWVWIGTHDENERLIK